MNDFMNIFNTLPKCGPHTTYKHTQPNSIQHTSTPTPTPEPTFEAQIILPTSQSHLI